MEYRRGEGVPTEREKLTIRENYVQLQNYTDGRKNSKLISVIVSILCNFQDASEEKNFNSEVFSFSTHQKKPKCTHYKVRTLQAAEEKIHPQ